MGRGRGEDWLVELASGEPAARRMATSGRPNGGVRRPSPNERPAVGRTAGSGDPRRTSECGERELTTMENCQNKANLLARFNDGRFRVTTEAKLRPLARFGCSMVWRWVSAFRASVSRLKAVLQRIATSRIAESVKRTMQRIVSVILPICVHLRNPRTRNLRVDSS